MCGVVAYIGDKPINFNLARLYEESLIRGLHAFGAAVYSGERQEIKRALIPIPIQAIIEEFSGGAILLHSRYSTSGDWEVLENNQPVFMNDIALVFNGVLSMKAKTEMEQEFEVQLETENDGELFIKMLNDARQPSNWIYELKGSFAGAWLDFQRKCVFIFRNERRPLWFCKFPEGIVYASTADIFRRAGIENCKQVEPCKLKCHYPV